MAAAMLVPLISVIRVGAAAGDVQRGICRREVGAGRFERHDLVAGRDHVGLQQPCRSASDRASCRSRPCRRRATTVFQVLSAPTVIDAGRVTRGRDAAEHGAALGVLAVVAGGRDDDQARWRRRLPRRGTADRTKHGSTIGWPSERFIDPNRILGAVRDHPLNAGDDVAGIADALAVEHADVDQMRAGRDAVLVERRRAVVGRRRR